MLGRLRWSPGIWAAGITNLLARTGHFLWKVGWVVPALVLVSACSSGAQATTTSSAIAIGDNGGLSMESQLIAGSLLLEETDVAIDKDQAGELLLLWKAFRSLSYSDTSAQAEIDAVITQIQDTMSAEQIQAIQAMQLTSDDLASVLQTRADQALPSAARAGGTSSSTAFGPTGASMAAVASAPEAATGWDCWRRRPVRGQS
jgi:hypothetical protein